MSVLVIIVICGIAFRNSVCRVVCVNFDMYISPHDHCLYVPTFRNVYANLFSVNVFVSVCICASDCLVVDVCVLLSMCLYGSIYVGASPSVLLLFSKEFAFCVNLVVFASVSYVASFLYTFLCVSVLSYLFIFVFG